MQRQTTPRRPDLWRTVPERLRLQVVHQPGVRRRREAGELLLPDLVQPQPVLDLGMAGPGRPQALELVPVKPPLAQERLNFVREFRRQRPASEPRGGVARASVKGGRDRLELGSAG